MSSRVREIREARGMRREDLAAKADVSFAYIYRLESDEPPSPGLAIARKIATALDVTVDELWPDVPAAEPAPSEAAS